MKWIYSFDDGSYLNPEQVVSVVPNLREDGSAWEVLIEMTNGDDYIYTHDIPLDAHEAKSVAMHTAEWILDFANGSEPIQVLPSLKRPEPSMETPTN